MRRVFVCLCAVVSLALADVASVQASESLTLAWDANTESDLAGYLVEYGTASGQYTQAIHVGNTTQLTVTGLEPNTTYYFAVRAYNTDGAASAHSNQIQYRTQGSGSTDTLSCVGGDPFVALGGGTCCNGGWLPLGMFCSTGALPSPPGSTPPPPPPPPSGGAACVGGDPFIAMGGGTCCNGGWLPPGMVCSFVGGTTPPPTTPPTTPPPTTPPPNTNPAACAGPDPFVFLGGGTCCSGGWLPPGMVCSGPPASTIPPPAPPPSSGGACSGSDPFVILGGGTCCRGGWLPPGMVCKAN